MKIYRRLNFLNLLWCFFGRFKIYYFQKSLALRILDRFLSIEQYYPIKKLSIGALKKVGNIRSSSASSALICVNNLKLNKSFCAELSKLFGIDFELTLTRYIFEKKYYETEALLIAKQLSSEQKDLISEDENWVVVKCLLSLVLLLPQFLYLYLYIINKQKCYKLNNKIICSVSDFSTYEMFSKIFSGYRNVVYCSETKANFLSNENILRLGFPSQNFNEWLSKSFLYSWFCVKNLKFIRNSNLNILVLFKLLFKGYSNTVYGNNNLFITFEHLTQVRGIRNQFLECAGSTSVFISKNTYVTYQQYPSEAYINYGLILASGSHMEEMLKQKGTITNRYLVVGGYDAAVGFTNFSNVKENQSINGSKIRVTILSAGICDETLQCELYLVGLAKALSACDSFEVSFRMKPIQIECKYNSFYSPVASDTKITTFGVDDGLFDSLPETDIYISSLSSSAFDLAAAGAKVLFVNNTHPLDTYIPWVKFPQYILTGLELSNECLTEVIKNRVDEVLKDKNYSYLICYVGHKMQNVNEYLYELRKALKPYTEMLKIET